MEYITVSILIVVACFFVGWTIGTIKNFSVKIACNDTLLVLQEKEKYLQDFPTLEGLSDLDVECLDFISKVLPEKVDRDIILKKMSECLNHVEIPSVTFFLGNGANGKSSLMWLFSQVISKHLIRGVESGYIRNLDKMNKSLEFPIETCFWINNTDEDFTPKDFLNLFQSCRMRGHMFICSNNTPSFNEFDKISFIKFPNAFVQNPKSNNEFKHDPYIHSKINSKAWKQTFLILLMSYF
jgi:hypothetical protein